MAIKQKLAVVLVLVGTLFLFDLMPKLAMSALSSVSNHSLSASAALSTDSSATTSSNVDLRIWLVAPQYLDEQVATSTITAPDIAPVSAAALGLGSGGEADANATAPALKTLALTNAAPASPLLYDVAVNFTSVNVIGSTPAVPGCNVNGQGAPRTFFDSFNGIDVNSGCTGHFIKLGTFTESGGSLHYNSNDAATVQGFREHVAAYDTTLKNGQGNFTVGSDFQLDAFPSDTGGTAYGVIFTNNPLPLSQPAFGMRIVTNSITGQTFLVAQNFQTGARRSVLVDRSVNTRAALFAFYDDTTKTVIPRYSFDGGTTFFRWLNTDGSTFSIPTFTNSSELQFQMYAIALVPVSPRQIVFVHGIKTSFRDVQNKIAGFQTLLADLENNGYRDKITYVDYYQDKGYQISGSANCTLQPQPNTNTGPLFSHSDSINSSVCDSQSAVAYDATRLDDTLSTMQGPITVIAYSMGAAAARGWLVLAQNKPGDNTVNLVDSLITIQGVHQGSYLADAGVALATIPNWASPLWVSVTKGALALAGWDVNRPAVHDLAPRSSWYRSVNPTSLPPNIHYYNFYSDIQATIRPQLFFVTLPPLGTSSFGDVLLLPGDPNPTATPLLGGARFLPGGAPSTDRHEYGLVDTHDVLLGDTISSLASVGIAATQILTDPINHFNLNQHLDDPMHSITSCKNGVGQTTVQAEILRILGNPAQACN